MPYSSAAIANFFIETAARAGAQVTPMKVQKLVYYAHGWYLAIAGVPLIDEQVEAWKYGPVVDSLFHELKCYGDQPVRELITLTDVGNLEEGNWDITTRTPTVESEAASTDQEDLELVKKVLQRVWEQYGPISAGRLSAMTHAKGGPWDITVAEHGGQPPKGTDIPMPLIRKHFEAILARGAG